MSSRGPSLFVTYSGKSGGAGRFLVDVVAGLAEPAVVACPPGEVQTMCRERAIPVLLLRERPLALRGGARTAVGAAAELSGHVREVRRLVRDLDPAVVISWEMRSALATAALNRRTRPPWIASQHDFVPRGPVGVALRRGLRGADAVVANSNAVRDNLRLERPVGMVLPGVDLTRFAPAADRNNEPPVALWLGAIVPWKRPGLAIDVAARLPDVTLRVAGEPLDASGQRLVDELRRRAGANPGVQLVGRVDSAEALARADVLLHTADREPFGIAIAEALASGVPVAAPAAGGPAEVVDESCGRLFPPGDADAAAAAVRAVLAQQSELARGARARAEERLDLERARREYGALVSRHARPPGSGAGADVALVTVTHDSARELDTLLHSARRHLPAAELVVVDSGSRDESVRVARDHGAQVVELENVGYGRAANAGVTRSSRRVTVVLNADVELLDSSLDDAAAELARADATDRILVPAVVLPDGRRQDVAQHEPATAPLAVLALAPPALLPRPVRIALEPWRADGPRHAGWPVGACIAARTETLRALGPFDPDVFLYAEDLDLGLRAADAGIETWFWPDARVLHAQAHATRRAFGGEPFELLARRRREVIAARRGRRRARLDDLIQAATFVNRIALKTLALRDTSRERRQLAALRAARRG